MSPRVANFEWDEANTGHIALHDVLPREVEEALRDPFCLLESSVPREAALRYNVTGETFDGRILKVIFEVLQRRIRTVTAYTAPKKNQAAYWTRRKHVD